MAIRSHPSSLSTVDCRLSTVDSRRSPAGFTVVEVLLFTFLALLVFGGVYLVLSRSMSLSDETTRSLELQVGVRNLMENLVADVNAAHVFLDPPGGITSTLALVKYEKEDAKERLELNTRPAYPFIETDAEQVDRLRGLRTTYLYDEQKRTVSRKVESGILLAREAEPGSGQMTQFEFQPEKTLLERTLATSVAAFDLTYVGYDDAGEPAPVEELADPKYSRTAFLLVRLKSVFDEGLYGTGLRRTPQIEIATKVWSYRRLYDTVYGQYFSSADPDARY